MSHRALCRISSEAISSDEAVQFVAGPESGGVVTFVGTARSSSSVVADREVLRLEYEAYVPMAEAMLETIAEEMLVAHAISRIALIHRHGIVLIGEAAIVVAVSAPHRAAGFEACRAAVDEVKRRLPLWKKEIYVDGGEWIGPGA
jgi:molybdopterin synthase catalytic subunit